jgi:hypothetical protein
VAQQATTPPRPATSRPKLLLVVVAAIALLAAATAAFVVTSAPDDLAAPPGTAIGSTVPPPVRGSVPPMTGTTGLPSAPEHTITVYGAPGTFRHLTLDTPVTSTGHDIGTVGVAGWGFEPGASAFFASVTDGGRVLFATVPQTDNQAAPTGQTMSIGVLDPTGGAGPTFRSLRVPTTKGLSYVVSPDRFTGGADVSDLCNVTTPDGPRTIGISALPYKDWDFNVFGVWPALASFGDDPTQDGAGAVTYRPEESRTADELRNDVFGKEAFALHANAYGTFADTRGLGECDVTPRGFVVASQYFFDEVAGGHSGSLVVFDAVGRVAAFHGLPDATLQADATLRRADDSTVVVPRGTVLELSPREVRADPHTTAPEDQRFIVVYDAAAPDPERPGERVVTPFSLQEFRFDETARTIVPTSDPIVTDRDGRADTNDGSYLRSNSTVYGPDGTLFVTRSATTGASSLLAAPMVVFRPGSLAGRPGTPAPWGTLVTPDAVLEAPSGASALTTIRSISFDDASSTVLMVGGVDARLRAFRWNGWDGGAREITRYCDVDLGGVQLANPTPGYRMQIRQGAIDTSRRLLYVPLQGLQPVGNVTVEEYLPQYAFAIRLDRVATPENEIGHCNG